MDTGEAGPVNGRSRSKFHTDQMRVPRVGVTHACTGKLVERQGFALLRGVRALRLPLRLLRSTANIVSRTCSRI